MKAEQDALLDDGQIMAAHHAELEVEAEKVRQWLDSMRKRQRLGSEVWADIENAYDTLNRILAKDNATILADYRAATKSQAERIQVLEEALGALEYDRQRLMGDGFFGDELSKRVLKSLAHPATGEVK